jgi:hypothetical protein
MINVDDARRWQEVEADALGRGALRRADIAVVGGVAGEGLSR